MCRVGRSQDVSSSVPARTRIPPSRAGPAIHDPQSGQTQRVVVRPLSARRWRARGLTPLSLNAVSGTTTPIENALAGDLDVAVIAQAGAACHRCFAEPLHCYGLPSSQGAPMAHGSKMAETFGVISAPA